MMDVDANKFMRLFCKSYRHTSTSKSLIVFYLYKKFSKFIFSNSHLEVIVMYSGHCTDLPSERPFQRQLVRISGDEPENDSICGTLYMHAMLTRSECKPRLSPSCFEQRTNYALGGWIEYIATLRIILCSLEERENIKLVLSDLLEAEERVKAASQ